MSIVKEVDINVGTTLQPFEDLQFPLKIEVIAILTFELRQINLFARNTPSVGIDCGVFNAKTKPRK